jgi:hypothetical protein
VLLNPTDFIWWTLAMLAGLIDHGGREQLRRIEFAQCEALEPRFLVARVTVQLSASPIPQFDVDPVRAALAEEDGSHASSVAVGRTKGKNRPSAD